MYRITTAYWLLCSCVSYDSQDTQRLFPWNERCSCWRRSTSSVSLEQNLWYYLDIGFRGLSLASGSFKIVAGRHTYSCKYCAVYFGPTCGWRTGSVTAVKYYSTPTQIVTTVMNSSFGNILQCSSFTDILAPCDQKFSFCMDWFLYVISIWLQYCPWILFSEMLQDWLVQWRLFWYVMNALMSSMFVGSPV